MIKLIFNLIIVILLVNSCNENITEPKVKKTYWAEPSEEGTRLYFRLFDSARIDSIIAGEIQYCLNIAKTVIEDTTIEVRKDWVFGDLLIKTSDELYEAFDTTDTFRFNYLPLDSLLLLYELKSGDKRHGSTGVCDDDISLEIDNEIYKFIFSLTGSCGRHFWEIHVVNDSAKFIKEWN